MDIQEALLHGAELHRTGRLAEAEAVYRAVLAESPLQPDALHLLGLIANAAGHADEAVQLISSALAAQPALPLAEYNLGRILQESGRVEAAEAAYRRSLARASDHAETHNNLGGVLQKQHRWDEALASYQQALRLKPDYAEAWSNLGTLLQDLQRPEEAVQAYRQALTLRPEYPAALHNLGEALQDLHRLEEAVLTYERALELEPNNPDAHCGLAFALLRQGEWGRGWQEYEWRWQRQDLIPYKRDPPGPAWNGSDPQGRTILMYAEQGFGDTIQFCRYAAWLSGRGARVVLECQPALERLLQSLDGVDQLVARGQPLPAFDAHVPLMSLPLMHGTTVDTIPGSTAYLSPPNSLLQLWKKRIPRARALRVGLVWAANPLHQQPRAYRSIPPAELAPLAITGARFFSLQVDAQPADLAAFPPGFDVVDLSPGIADFADTAAAVAQLDLVITVDTAVAHLAGALGKPVWVLLPFASEWRWLLERSESPWYASMRLFRQPIWGDWASVVQTVAEALASLTRSQAR